MNRIATFLATLALVLTAHAQTELTTTQAKTLVKNTTKKRVSVHDPSVVWDETSKRYYIFGTHRACAYSTDLQNWTSFSSPWKVGSNNNAANDKAFVTPAVKKVMKGGQEVDFPQFNAMEWAARTDANYNINGNMWAPDVIWNPTMKKWCQYLSINGDQWHSSIILLTSDKIEGPYLYQGPVVISGFYDSQHSYKDTDLELVLGEQKSLPSRYSGTWATTRAGSWPNNIDPCVFYDEEGRLWMSYGSWSGGIWMLELDETTGLRDYDVTYSVGANSDPYFGKRIAGGYYVSGEASYIEYVGGYYYLFVTYGGLDSVGGYVMRVFRSDKPDGPYKDISGRNAIFTEYKMNYGKNADTRGVKIMGAYDKWGYQTVGELSQGHNSVIAANDGRTYLVYHTRFNDGTEGFQVRVHQLFQNERGWLVASPFEYNGEQLTDADIRTREIFTTKEIVGTYQLLLHKYDIDYKNREVVTPVELTLTADGKVSGAKTGTWSITEGTSYLKLVLGGVAYNGVIFEQQMDGRTVKTVSFSAVANSGVCVWGYKVAPLYNLALQVNGQKMPVTNNQTVSRDIDLYGMDVQQPGISLFWKSSQPDIISDYGKYNPYGLAENTKVTLTARLETTGWFWTEDYTVTALSEENAAQTADWQTGMVAHYGFDNDRLANSMDATQTASLQNSGSTALPTLEQNFPLRTGKYVHLNHGTNGKESFVQMPNPLLGQTLDEGATLSFWVYRTNNNLWDALFGFVNGNARFYMTGNIYLGYNDDAGKWLDINHPNTVETTELPAGGWHLVTIVIQRKGGITVYIDGTARRNDKYNGETDGKSITTKSGFDYNYIVDHLSASPDFYLGKGSFWGSPDALFDDVIAYNRPLSYAEVLALRQMENRAYDFSKQSSAGIANQYITTPSVSHSIVDLQGRRMGQSPLKRGLYIVDGRKVFVP